MGKMTEEQAPWNKEKAQKYSDMMEKVSKHIDAPFSKRIVENLELSERSWVILDSATGPGFLSIELHKLLPLRKLKEKERDWIYLYRH